MASSQEASDDDIVQVQSDETPPADRERTTRELSRADAAELARNGTLKGALVAPESSFDTWARYRARRLLLRTCNNFGAKLMRRALTPRPALVREKVPGDSDGR